jgi:hypothetical protein
VIAILGPGLEKAQTGFISGMPEIQDLVISGMELEKRNNNTRLIIDFVSYAPGSYSLPLIRVPSADKELIIGGIEITVASILSPDLMVLSDPALPLAVPGTGLVVYGGAGAILLAVILGVVVFIWAERSFGPLREKFRIRRLSNSLEHRLKQLRNSENDRQMELFSLLAGDYRVFLSYLTGVNCRVLSPVEFLDFPVLPDGDFLCSLFRRFDRLRFSGTPAARMEVLEILDELGSFLLNIKNAEKR